MKKLFTLLLFTVIFYGAQAQMRIGIVGGPHSSSVIEKNDLEGWDAISPYIFKRKSINVGIIAETPIGHSKYLYFQPGIYYTGKGNWYQRFFDTALTATKVDDTMFHRTQLYTNYIDIPLNVALKLPLGKKCNFFISAGPYVSFFYDGKKTNESRLGNLITTTSQEDSAYVDYQKTEENIEVGKHTNKATTFDAGINARAGFELGPVLLTGFMSQGLINFYNTPYNGTLKHRVIGASFGFWISKKVTVKPSDRDKDGVPDKSDACPDVPGLALTGGCPDTDGDGVADAVDKCPQVPGMPRYKGCPIPDTDGDGVNDEDDKCPDKVGNLKYQGCPVPDTDGDGLNDVSDFCPDKPGPVDNNGCPIPDSDNDGVNDKEDKCPAVAGSKENNGCPVIKQEIVEKVNYAAKKIFFAAGSDKISPASFTALNEVATILKANPTLKLSVEGHSDNVGKPASNLNLSQKRADAVKNYLVQNGIDGNRLEAKGFGQEQPVSDNSTPEGRAANRRVELKLSQQ